MGQKAVLVDMDGTMVDVRSVRHLLGGETRDFSAFHAGSLYCPPHQVALDWCDEKVRTGHRLVIVTARMYRWEEMTRLWLSKHLSHPYDGPFMRGDLDYRPDDEVKRDIHRILVEDHGYDIVAAIDDNPRIVALWQELNIPVTIVPGWEIVTP